MLSILIALPYGCKSVEIKFQRLSKQKIKFGEVIDTPFAKILQQKVLLFSDILTVQFKQIDCCCTNIVTKIEIN